MTKIQVVKTDEQLYEELIGKVMKIDANAALYMATGAKELQDFVYGDLLGAFDWGDTPQGHIYWRAIYHKLIGLDS